jgi:hypothetical protein
VDAPQRGTSEVRGPRIFRIAAPVSRIEALREFYEEVLGIAVDDTVPSRLGHGAAWT